MEALTSWYDERKAACNTATRPTVQMRDIRSCNSFPIILKNDIHLTQASAGIVRRKPTNLRNRSRSKENSHDLALAQKDCIAHFLISRIFATKMKSIAKYNNRLELKNPGLVAYRTSLIKRREKGTNVSDTV